MNDTATPAVSISALVAELHARLEEIARGEAPRSEGLSNQGAILLGGVTPATAGPPGASPGVDSEDSLASPPVEQPGSALDVPVPKAATIPESCGEADHDWTLRSATEGWVCRQCGASAPWEIETVEDSDGAADTEGSQAHPIFHRCSVCDEEVVGRLRKYRGHEVCQRCYEALSGTPHDRRKAEQAPATNGQRAAKASSVSTASGSPDVEENAPKPPGDAPKEGSGEGEATDSERQGAVHSGAKASSVERRYPIESLKSLSRNFEQTCHRVWDSRTGKDRWGTSDESLVDFVHACAKDVVQLVDSGVLNPAEISAYDWIRFFARLPDDARKKLRAREEAKGNLGLPSSLGTACMKVTHRVRANAGSADPKCRRLLDQPLEHLVNEAFIDLRRHAVRIAKVD